MNTVQKGRTFLITAGGMKEKIDKVRSIINVSKGTLGAVLASEILANETVIVDKIFLSIWPIGCFTARG
jgi:phosphopantothenoylcysteine synthetase/decarboxylase